MNIKDLDEVMKALQEEIERAENQMAIADTRTYWDPETNTEMSKRKRWKRYVKTLYEKAAELALLGLSDDGH